MADPKTHSTAEIAAALRDLLVQKLAKHEADITALRAREQKLAKHELCPLCGGPDRNGVCACLHKNSPATPGSGIPSSTGMGSTGGGGTQPMAMGEGCKECGGIGSHKTSCNTGLKNPKTLKKDNAGLSDVGQLSKHMPTSSASALAPKPPAPATSVGQANKELGGFQSITGAHPAVAGGTSKVMGLPGARKPLHAMGRPTVAVSGEIPNAKSEKNPGSARSPYGTGGDGHASQTNMPSNLKANMATVAKSDEKTIPMTAAADERKLPGTKMPKAAKKQAAETGAGGEISKGKELRKDGLEEAKGVSGKQPVGQGGGDAHKVAPGAAGVKGKLPAPPAGKKPVPGNVSYDIDVSDFAAKPSRFGKPTGAPVGNPAAVKFATAKSPIAGQRMKQIGSAPAANAGGATDALRDKMNLAADKKAGGVGFLNALLAKFGRKPTAPQGIEGFQDGARVPINTAPVRSQRFHGALPLRRSEKPMFKMESLGKCAMCKSTEHSGACK